MTPAIAVTLGTTVGDEPLTPFTLAGSALIVGGIVLVVRTGKSAAQEAPDSTAAQTRALGAERDDAS